MGCDWVDSEVKEGARLTAKQALQFLLYLVFKGFIKIPRQHEDVYHSGKKVHKGTMTNERSKKRLRIDEEMLESCIIIALPSELLIHIFSFLSLEELNCVQLVCK